MFGNKESNTYLSQILDRQNEILTELRDINNNIVKYFGEEYDLKEKTLIRDIKNAHFTRNQFDVLKEVIEHTREKHFKNINKECEHNWILEEQEIIKQKVSYRKYKCSICGKEQIRKDEIQDNGSVNVTLWERV